MKIYVQSRGVDPEDDYRWLKIDQENQVQETPSFLNQAIASGYPSLVSLIDSHKFSLVLARMQNNLVLLVTGLVATNAQLDFMGRKIRNSIFWIAASEKEEEILRAITVAALQARLAELVEEAINRTESCDYGFTVDNHKLLKIADSIYLSHHDSLKLNCQIGHNCENLRQEIALEMQANQLPPQYQLLVVVTTIKSDADLQKMHVWRGLSNRVESSQLIPANSGSLVQVEQKKTLATTAVIATVILVLTVFLIL